MPVKTRSAVTLSALLVLAGCAAAPQDRIVLLPDRDGRVGEIEVRTARGSAELKEAYAAARVKDAVPVAEKTDVAAVTQRYGKVLDALPTRPQRYTLNFEFGSDRLTAASRAMVPGIQADLRRFPAPEVVVIGHTDAVGDPGYNDKLSLDRANRVREILVGAGIPRDEIQTVGRGAREPLVSTRPGVPEPRNRRVEIKLR
jgi:outer membrane protein OmpA-like peptidoglycan-associated protein